MAQKVHVVLTDDIDQSTEDVKNVTFSLEGTTWEIDLSAKNLAALRESLKPYTDNGRRTSGGRAKAPARGRGSSAGNAGEIREWARSKGMTVNDRGRVPAEVRAAYEAAHS